MVARFEKKNRNLWKALAEKIEHDDVLRLEAAREARPHTLRLIEYGVEQLVDVQALNLLRVQSQAHFGVPF